MESKLEYIFANVNDWLKYAEAKNVGLVALNGAILVGLLQSVSTIRELELALQLYFLLIAFCSLVSCSIGLMSLFARLQAPWWLSWVMKHKKEPSDNPVFFMDSSKYSGNQLFETVKTKYPSQVVNEASYCLNLCEQISANSKIATIKFHQFNLALTFLMGGILTPIGFLVYNYIKK